MYSFIHSFRDGLLHGWCFFFFFILLARLVRNMERLLLYRSLTEDHICPLLRGESFISFMGISTRLLRFAVHESCIDLKWGRLENGGATIGSTSFTHYLVRT